MPEGAADALTKGVHMQELAHAGIDRSLTIIAGLACVVGTGQMCF